MLKNAPLKEVIFELHWILDFIPEQNIYSDLEFNEAVMKFQNSCSPGFKEFQILTPSIIPYSALTNKVTHRFFKEKGQHPLYQMGPGVFTANDNNKNYSWIEFSQLIKDGLKCLKASYKKELILAKIELRYIDAVEIDIFGQTDKFTFLKENLNVNAESYPFVDGVLVDINFKKRFAINDESYLNLDISTGIDTKTNKDIVIWHTFINNRCPISWEKLVFWLESAHEITSTIFKKMTSTKLYEYFN